MDNTWCLDDVWQFINVIKGLQIGENLFESVSNLYEQLETLDVDLSVPVIKKDDRINVETKNKIINLINFYYDNIEVQINQFDQANTNTFLSMLKSNALEITQSFKD